MGLTIKMFFCVQYLCLHTNKLSAQTRDGVFHLIPNLPDFLGFS